MTCLRGQAAALSSMAASLRGELTGPLRVSCFTPLSPCLSPPIVEFFAVDHPAVELEILEASADHLQHLLDGTLAVALMISSRMRPQVEVAEVLWGAPARVILPTTHPLASLPAVP